MAIFNGSEDATTAVRLIIPHYKVGFKDSDVNRYMLEKTVAHLRRSGKVNGVYKLGHGLELILDQQSEIWEELPF